MSSETSKQLAVFERKILRKILGAIKTNCWRRRHNNEPMQLYGHLDIVSFIRINRLRWCIKFLLFNLKEVSQEVDPNPDGGTVCMVI
jgi:hypothetical protein